MTLSTGRVRQLLRTYGEACELSADPIAQTRHLLGGLTAMVGAIAYMRVQVHDYLPGCGFDIRDGQEGGFDDDFRRRMADYYYSESGTEPALRRMIPRHDELERHGVVSIRRADVIDDRGWY